MLCDNCGKELTNGTVYTKGGNELDYSECADCGVVEVLGMDVEKDD